MKVLSRLDFFTTTFSAGAGVWVTTAMVSSQSYIVPHIPKLEVQILSANYYKTFVINETSGIKLRQG